MKLTFLFLVILIQVYGQDKQNSHKKDGYSIDYPGEWQLVVDGAMGMKFMLLSPTPSTSFRDNINLIIEDLTGKNITLDGYTSFSANQVKQLITDAQILTDKRIADKHELSFSGMQRQFKLKWCQYYWVKNEKAFVLTFTASQDTFETSIEEAKRIMSSFKVD